jgi:hypothetical protein
MEERKLSAIAMTRLGNGAIGQIEGMRQVIRHMANMMNDSNADCCKYTLEFADESENTDETVIIPEIIIQLRCGKSE